MTSHLDRPTPCSRLALVLLICACSLAACSDDHSTGNPLLGEVVRQDDASEEALANIADTYELSGGVPNAQAATWVSPEAVPPLDPATPPTFEWSDDTAASARHGVTTGKFVWLRIAAPGVEEPLDVVSIETTTFTPSGAQWARLSTGSTITARLLTAQLDNGMVVLGPFEPADSTRTYTLGN